MKNLYKLILTLRKDLSILFMTCIITVCVIDFWLIHIPELFNGGAAFGVIADKLCLSYISAFIFYFLVVHTKQQKDKENMYAYVSNKVWHIIAYGTTIIREMAKASNVELKSNYPSEQELLEVCSKINPCSDAPLLISFAANANWYQYFEYYRKMSSEDTQSIYGKMPFLDTKLIKHLADIEDTQWFSLVKAVSPIPIQFKNKNLLNFWSAIIEYLKSVKALQDYYNKKLLVYHDKPWGDKPLRS